MDAPSINLAGLLIIGGALLGWLCARSIVAPPPHYSKELFAKWLTWLGLFGGLTALGSGVVMAVRAWQVLSELPPGGG